MAIETCARCGAKNRVDERVLSINLRPVCGRCGAKLGADAEASGSGPSQKATPGGARASKPQVVTDATFNQDVLSASGSTPVLLDCWAEWCGPCRMVAPVLDQLSAESDGRYVVAKLNVDENPLTASQLGIRSIPTLLIFKNGQVVDRIVGAQPKQVLATRLAAHV